MPTTCATVGLEEGAFSREGASGNRDRNVGVAGVVVGVVVRFRVVLVSGTTGVRVFGRTMV